MTKSIVHFPELIKLGVKVKVAVGLPVLWVVFRGAFTKPVSA